jgi:hypothetical protein
MPTSRTGKQEVVDAVRRRAEEQGFVVSRDVRAELRQAGLADTLWKEIVKLAGPALSYRQGRYYYVPAGPPRLRARVRREHRQHRTLTRAVRFLIRQQRAAEAVQIERRSHPRMHFVCPVQAQTDDRRVLNLLSREISVCGVRLIGSYDLLGRKIHLWIPRPDDNAERCCFLVQILWSAHVADGLWENGGVFLELVDAEPSGLKLTPPD